MKTRCDGKSVRGIVVLAGAALACVATVQAQTWKPEHAVELIAPSGPGGGTDKTARLIQRVWQNMRAIEAPVNVVNKPGGGNTIALTYLKQHAGDAHYLLIVSAVVLTSHIVGRSTINYTDFAPIAQLNSEYVAFAVRSDSPLKSGADLLARLRQDPGALSIAVGTSLGGANHIAAALAARAAGADIRKLKPVVFKSSAESVTALLGGHVDLVTSGASFVAGQFRQGALRLLALAAPRRGAGVLATVPTWREQGHDIVSDNFRNVLAAAGINVQQVRYWEDAAAKLARSDEWKKDLEANLWENTYMNSFDSRKYLDAQYAQLKEILTDLGLAK